MDTQNETDNQKVQDLSTDEFVSFWEQLHRLPSSTESEGSQRGQRVNIFKQRKDFCLKYLDELMQRATSTEADVVSTLILRVYVRFELAHFEWRLGNISAAKETLSLALTEAQQTKDEQTIYAAFDRLGQFSLNVEDFDEAVVYFQRAIGYAHAQWPHDLTDVLFFLGEAWSYRLPTVPLAIAIFDWLCQLQPVRMDARERKYACLLQLGETEQVKTEAAKKTFTSCLEAASTVAARIALRQRKRARTAAVEGLRLAQEEQNAQWQSYFESLESLLKN
jgi:tetratricopeptide (TPR) repeat protein